MTNYTISKLQHQIYQENIDTDFDIILSYNGSRSRYTMIIRFKDYEDVETVKLSNDNTKRLWELYTAFKTGYDSRNKLIKERKQWL